MIQLCLGRLDLMAETDCDILISQDLAHSKYLTCLVNPMLGILDDGYIVKTARLVIAIIMVGVFPESYLRFHSLCIAQRAGKRILEEIRGMLSEGRKEGLIDNKSISKFR